MNRRDLRPLVAEGVSPWLDGIHRDLTSSGELSRLVAETGLRGATSNPEQLAARLHRDPVYLEQLARLADHRVSVEGAVWAASVHDLRQACDVMLPVFTDTHGYDGLVSMDMDPRMAHDAAATTAEATELARAVARPNMLVKIPATLEGLEALRGCVAAGIGVHVTGVYSVRRYGEVVDAYFDGLEKALADGRQLSAIASVASLPVGRLDREVDGRLAEIGGPDAGTLRGRAGLAVARLMYRAYEERLGSARWRALRASGARPQRLLWSASALADPAAARARYVEGLVSWGTVHAMTRPVLDEAADRLELRGDTLMGQHETAQTVLDSLGRLGISYDAVERRLEADTVTGLIDSWLGLHTAVGARMHALAVTRPGS
ncbi:MULTISPECIES: transaldolase [Kitasatospora]|uniref:Transaldolase n=2 Tax=Kitasatospora TaxID=2063 RepID=A0ABT1J7E4_9ACTN|nr:transaldolase [Kitasatospora paracochleata]MCP2313357.1 transaldolase [Kitasatospora paracochleata]